ncbi:MAG TPA: DNA polymerase III subunit delta [Casimicrobiaceae bacterium]|nr:DNA polymerase III subunit delta [Casimicrobiaceae bacterium]
MQLRPRDLDAHLARTLAPLYVVHGDEPLFAIEAADAIRAAARRAGCDEREMFIVEQHFKWDAFVAANANLGLFAQRKLIDVRIPSGKPGTEGAAALERHARNLPDDNVTLVSLPRVDRATQSSAWFTALAECGVAIGVAPLDRAALPAWITERLSRNRQRVSSETLAFLADRCEGNLLAARQEIEKLALLLPAGELDHDAVERAVADVARYDIQELSCAWLNGDAARALRILDTLQSEGEPITLVGWQLGEDLHALAALQEAMAHGQALSTAIRNVRVWGKRQPALERATRRVDASRTLPLIASLAKLDALAKGIGEDDPWDAAAAIALGLCAGPSLPARRSLP